MRQREQKHQGARRVREGTVTSDAMDKTRVVQVERRVRHPLYGKEVKQAKKLYVHDETNASQRGDTVRIALTRPLSKTKRWVLVDVVERASRVAGKVIE